MVQEQLRDHSQKIGVTVQPVFVSKKTGKILNPKLRISNVLFIILHLIGAIQIRLGIQLVIFTNALLNTKIVC